MQGQWKLFWGQWKVREKSGNFLGSNEWQPCWKTPCLELDIHFSLGQGNRTLLSGFIHHHKISHLDSLWRETEGSSEMAYRSCGGHILALLWYKCLACKGWGGIVRLYLYTCCTSVLVWSTLCVFIKINRRDLFSTHCCCSKALFWSFSLFLHHLWNSSLSIPFFQGSVLESSQHYACPNA